MNVEIRPATPADSAALGDIAYRAFKTVAETHGFLPDLPDAGRASGMMARLIAHLGFFNAVAEIDGRVVGSIFSDERGPIGGLGPVTIDPVNQDAGVGRALMQAALQRCDERALAGLRLVQAGYHCRSLALYLKLGFCAREPLVCLQGPAISKAIPGHLVRAAQASDIEACNALCLRVHGHSRAGEVSDAVAHGLAGVVEREERITGYTTALAFFGHTIGESNSDVCALIGAGEVIQGAGLLVPTRNSELVRWCLAQNLRITQPMTLMSMGLYNEPSGAWLPSVLY